MWNKLSVMILGIALAVGLPQAAKAETVTEKVARTGVLTFGTRVDAIPYAYVNDKEELVGYAVDIVELIRQEMQTMLGRPVTLQAQVINDPSEVMQKISKSDLDIACGVQFTWQREKYVDFSIPFSLSGIRLLVKQNSPLTGTSESLVGKRVGVVPNSMGEVVMKVVQPQAVLVPLKEAEAGFVALESGKVDAIAGDTIVLAGNTLRGNPANFALVPEQPYGRYGVSCIVPENNSTFLDAVNQAIAKLMQGYVIGDQKSVAMVNRWLGPEGLVELPESLIRTYFELMITSRESIPLTDAGKKPN